VLSAGNWDAPLLAVLSAGVYVWGRARVGGIGGGGGLAGGSAIALQCLRGVQPGGIASPAVYAHVVRREPTPGGPGWGWRRGRRRSPPQLPLLVSIGQVKPAQHQRTAGRSPCAMSF
jgi:hypothetical protein